MNVQSIPLETLRQPPRNVRIHSQKQLDEYCRSLEKFGQTKPIICDENYTILAGNGLYLAMKARGETEAWCNIITGLSEADKKKLMLADNKVYDLGITDHSGIDEILKELDGNFDIPGYDDSMLEMLTMSFRETDEFVGSYGSFAPEDIEKIQAKAASEQNPSETPQQGPQGTPEEGKYLPGDADKAQSEALQRPQGGKFVVCPHCGTQICL